MRNCVCVLLEARNESPGTNEELQDHPSGGISTVSSFPKASNEWGCTDSRYQWSTRNSSVRVAATFQERVASSIELPFLMENEFHFSPPGFLEPKIKTTLVVSMWFNVVSFF